MKLADHDARLDEIRGAARVAKQAGANIAEDRYVQIRVTLEAAMPSGGTARSGALNGKLSSYVRFMLPALLERAEAELADDFKAAKRDVLNAAADLQKEQF